MSNDIDVEINSAAHYPAADVPGLIELAEQAGFGAFWKGESNSTDPLSFCFPAIAARTKTLKLGTAIYHIYGRSPVTLGIQSATLQDLSGGRLLLGLGVANKTIAAWHGWRVRPSVAPRPRIYRYRSQRLPPASASNTRAKSITPASASSSPGSRSHPDFPIYLAGLGPQMTKLVGKISDGVFINMATPATIREIAAACARAPWKRAAIRTKLEIIAKVRVSLQSRPGHGPLEAAPGADVLQHRRPL